MRLQGQPFQILAYFIRHPGQVVTRGELQQQLWKGSTFVDFDQGLNAAMNRLRQVLGDSADRPRYIETLPGRGYRFIAPVQDTDAKPVLVTGPAPAEEIEPPLPLLPEIGPAPRKARWQIAGIPLALTTAAAVFYYSGFWSAGPRASATSVTIVVLPFRNLSGDPEQEYFSDGLTEETIAALGRITPSRIRVIAWTSSMAYKGTRKTAGEIGSELGASYLVESTVRRDTEHVRIAANLIRVKDHVQVWNNTYDLQPSGLLRVQQEIGTAIARQVGDEFSPRSEQAASKSLQNADTHDLYLRGRYYWYQRTPESMRKSAEYFTAALQKDPSYALAHAGLADAYVGKP